MIDCIYQWYTNNYGQDRGDFGARQLSGQESLVSETKRQIPDKETIKAAIRRTEHDLQSAQEAPAQPIEKPVVNESSIAAAIVNKINAIDKANIAQAAAQATKVESFQTAPVANQTAPAAPKLMPPEKTVQSGQVDPVPAPSSPPAQGPIEAVTDLFKKQKPVKRAIFSRIGPRNMFYLASIN